MEKTWLEKLEVGDGVRLPKEVVESILAENQKDIDAKTAEIAAANGTIKDLQGKVKAFDGVDVEALKSDFAALQTKYETDLAAERMNGALEKALVGARAKNTVAVRALLDMEQIKLDGDKLAGLDTQIDKLKTDAAYLFEETPTKTGAKVDTGINHGEGGKPEPKNLQDAIAAKLNNEK